MIVFHEVTLIRRPGYRAVEYRITYDDASLFIAEVPDGDVEPPEVVELNKWLEQVPER